MSDIFDEAAEIVRQGLLKFIPCPSAGTCNNGDGDGKNWDGAIVETVVEAIEGARTKPCSEVANSLRIVACDGVRDGSGEATRITAGDSLRVGGREAAGEGTRIVAGESLRVGGRVEVGELTGIGAGSSNTV